MLFVVGVVTAEHVSPVLAKIETETERVLGSFRPKDYEALVAANIPNGGRLNRVLEHMGIPYAPHPVPGSDASRVATKKRKAEVSKKHIMKRVKVGLSWVMPSQMTVPPSKPGLSRKVIIVKTTRPKTKPGRQGTYEI
jgi:hypothetical protein